MTEAPSHPGLPVLGNTVEMIRDQLGMHETIVAEHGDVVWVDILGVGEYCIVAHPDIFEQILVTDRDTFAKTEDFRIAFGESVLTTEGERWQAQRGALDEFFYPERIRSYADDMVRLTARRIDRWQAGETISLRQEMKALTLENLFGALFDRDLAIDGDERIRQAAGDLNLWFKSTTYAMPRWLPTPARRQFREAVDTLESVAHSLLAERRREGAEGDDLLSTLVRLREGDETAMSDDEIADQIVTMVFAGHDTTAMALIAALYELSTHPEVRDRFHAELDAVVGDDQPTLADVGDLTLTENIIDETLRLYPSVFTLPRKTTEATTLDGYDVPADTRIHMSTWRVHRDPRFWDDPTTWKPARWEGTTPRDQGYAFIPFGAGPRTCIGRRFARLEAKLVLATIGQQFRLEPQRALELEPEMTLQPSHDMPTRVRRR